MSDKNIEFVKIEDVGSEFILHHHLGLGDSIVCNGLVNYLSKQYLRVYLPVKESIFETIKYLYSENEKVTLFKISNEKREEDIYNFAVKNDLNILRVGYSNIKDVPFNLAFYKQLNLPYRYTYKYFHLPMSINKEMQLKDHLVKYYKVNASSYSLVHNEYQWPGGTFELDKVDEKNTIFVTKESDLFKNLLLYRKLIEDAKSIHCINGSFLHLVERIKTDAKLYYHHVRKNKLHLGNNWTYVDYED